MKPLILTFCFLITLTMITAQEVREELFVGWNHLFSIGADLNQIAKINPRIGQEGSSLRWGGDFEMQNIFADPYFEFRNRLLLQLSGFRNETDQFLDSLTQTIINPFRKNYDRLEWQLSFSKEITPDRDFFTMEQYMTTTLTTAFDGNYFKRAAPNLRKLSGFLSPALSTTSAGLERRKGNLYSLYFAPLALKILYVGNDEIASLPAINTIGDTIEFFGTGIHGNDMVFDTINQRVISFRKSKAFLGSQLVFRYRREIIPERLELENESRLFLDYLNSPLQLDIQLNGKVNFLLFKGLQISFVVDLIRDNNLIFQSADLARTNQIPRSTFTKGTSYMHRILLRYTFE